MRHLRSHSTRQGLPRHGSLALEKPRCNAAESPACSLWISISLVKTGRPGVGPPVSALLEEIGAVNENCCPIELGQAPAFEVVDAGISPRGL